MAKIRIDKKKDKLMSELGFVQGQYSWHHPMIPDLRGFPYLLYSEKDQGAYVTSQLIREDDPALCESLSDLVAAIYHAGMSQGETNKIKAIRQELRI